MSEQDMVKEAVAQAEKEARDKQIGEVKKIVTKTLEKLDEVRKDIKKLQEEERVLKMDIDDLKDGRLDRISERQEKDPEAKKVSVVLIIKEKEVIREVSPWYFPYQVIWQTPYVPVYRQTPLIENRKTLFGDVYGVGLDNSVDLSNGASFSATNTGGAGLMTITCSAAKDASIGTYDVNGHIVHLR